MTLFHLVLNLGYAGSVCRIMGRSRVPKEFVVFPVLQRAVRRSRTDIRVPHQSMPRRRTPAVDQVEYQR